MFYGIKTGVGFPHASDALINHILSAGDVIAFVERPLPNSLEQQAGFVTQAEVDDAYRRIRLWLYQNQADPLFFKEQRGESEIGGWVRKVNEIKSAWATPDLIALTIFHGGPNAPKDFTNE